MVPDEGQEPTYDRIEVGYAAVRRPDDRFAAIIDECLGDAQTVVNVGAGAGFYEPDNRRVVALDPSRLMLTQHPPTLEMVRDITTKARGTPAVGPSYRYC